MRRRSGRPGAHFRLLAARAGRILGGFDGVSKKDDRTMTMDKSLRLRRGLIRSRSVLSRAERLAQLTQSDRWKEGDSVFGLPKVRVFKLTMKKKKKKKEEGAEGEAAAGAAPAAAAADAKKPEGKKAESKKK